ncbi:MAG: hypothetical protein ACRD2G_05550, partial [Terriglobia bacterium]
MDFRRAAILLPLTAAWLTSCAAPRRYQPASIVPAQTASSLEARTLNDPGLKQFIVQSMGRPIAWPPKTWD